MQQYGGLNTFRPLGILILFCLYLGLYHGFFGLLIALLAGGKSGIRRALVAAPVRLGRG